METTDSRQYLTLFPEYGAYAWIADEPGMLGLCTGSTFFEDSDDCCNSKGFQEEYGLSDELVADIVEWSDAFEYSVMPNDAIDKSKAKFLHPIYKMLDYRAETLARRLKAEVGDRYHVQYCTLAKDGPGFVEV